MKTWEYKILDHKYQNLKRWFQAMAENHPAGLNSAILLDKIIGPDGMFEWLEKIEDKLFDCSSILEALKTKERK